MGVHSNLGQPFRQKQKGLGLGWEESRLSRYDIHDEGTLPPSITVIARVHANNICICVYVHAYSCIGMCIL